MEAQSTGARFGQGIYFGDMFEKSYNYVRADGSQYEFMLLCEVALGESYTPEGYNYETELPEGKNSVWIKSKRGPDHSKRIVLPNGVQIPISPVINYPNIQDSYARYYQHNEFIVKDASQVRVRYLVQMQARHSQ